MKNREVGTGTKTTLSCVISALKQEVTVKWSLADKELESDVDYSISSVIDIEQANTQTSTLTVNNPAQSGKYLCTVFSQFSPLSPSSSSIAQLHLYGKTSLLSS